MLCHYCRDFTAGPTGYCSLDCHWAQLHKHLPIHVQQEHAVNGCYCDSSGPCHHHDPDSGQPDPS